MRITVPVTFVIFVACTVDTSVPYSATFDVYILYEWVFPFLVHYFIHLYFIYFPFLFQVVPQIIRRQRSSVAAICVALQVRVRLLSYSWSEYIDPLFLSGKCGGAVFTSLVVAPGYSECNNKKLLLLPFSLNIISSCLSSASGGNWIAKLYFFSFSSCFEWCGSGIDLYSFHLTHFFFLLFPTLKINYFPHWKLFVFKKSFITSFLKLLPSSLSFLGRRWVFVSAGCYHWCSHFEWRY